MGCGPSFSGQVKRAVVSAQVRMWKNKTSEEYGVGIEPKIFERRDVRKIDGDGLKKAS